MGYFLFDTLKVRYLFVNEQLYLVATDIPEYEQWISHIPEAEKNVVEGEDIISFTVSLVIIPQYMSDSKKMSVISKMMTLQKIIVKKNAVDWMIHCFFIEPFDERVVHIDTFPELAAVISTSPHVNYLIMVPNTTRSYEVHMM